MSDPFEGTPSQVEAVPADSASADPLDAGSSARGRTVFESPDTGCASCHSGWIYTNNLRVDVGTGGRFKIPSLVGVGWRAPFLHDGCAATLRERFGSCGGASHGNTAALRDDQVSDLVVYLESL